ncbi:MAG: hypothetical protein ACK4K7_12245 [Allosphingosinicella sp.]|uniref:hypothetical protein n=1 Tax=Allosphingosinicella sp. TaxID=2823234 RepID=UPI0039405E4C
MRIEPIIEVTLDQGGLRVRPAATRFTFIYRAAMEVSWDEDAGALTGPRTPGSDPVQLFRRMLRAAADEYGVVLRITASTRWTGVPADLQRELEVFSAGDWARGFEAERKRSNELGWNLAQMQQLLSDAAPLWAEQRYAEYVRLLAPYRDRLSPAQLKRLEMAERRAGS